MAAASDKPEGTDKSCPSEAITMDEINGINYKNKSLCSEARRRILRPTYNAGCKEDASAKYSAVLKKCRRVGKRT